MAENSDTNKRNPIVMWFSLIIVLTMLIHIGYFCYTGCIFTKSQNTLVKEHINHIAKIDSIFFCMKEAILSTDSGVISNAPALLSQLQKDSALFRREVLLSQEEMSNLTELHLNKLGNDYDQIGIWFGVGSVIFLVISFFSMFKIEESKKDAKDLFENIKTQSIITTGQIKGLQSQASELNTSLNGIRDEGTSFIQRKTEEFEELKTNLNKTLGQSSQDSEKIQEYLKEFENKNGQYQMTLEMMEKQIKQYQDLFQSLQEMLEMLRKEANNG